ncbi:MAG: hypothetical protein U0Q22_14230 [Acidimicrobiales bacterium]
MGRSAPGSTDLLTPRWRGQGGRLEVWYATFTDEASGDGLWLHHERVAPPDGTAPHDVAWAATFPADGAPSWAHTDAVELGASGSAGVAGDIAWDLRWDLTGERPLYTFPRWAWQRELLPAAQVVAAPTLRAEGTVDGRAFAGTGALSRIYGHGNARRWGWLHADLGGGDVVELVTAVSTRPGLRALPPISHLRYRIDGVDGPSFDGPSFRLSTRLGLPTWTVRGRIGRDRVRIDVTQPPERSVAIGYHDPDGATATCTNSERADIVVEIGDRRWDLRGTGHAEVGTRP